jgi:hypothetical protein
LEEGSCFLTYSLTSCYFLTHWSGNCAARKEVGSILVAANTMTRWLK